MAVVQDSAVGSRASNTRVAHVPQTQTIGTAFIKQSYNKKIRKRYTDSAPVDICSFKKKNENIEDFLRRILQYLVRLPLVLLFYNNIKLRIRIRFQLGGWIRVFKL